MGCLNCGKDTEKNNKYCSHNCSSVFNNKTRGTERKLKLVEMYGGKCQNCGYNKCVAALHFHHVDPQQKEFQLKQRSLASKTWEKVIAEANKCILLCANCHAEHHSDEEIY